MKMLEAKNIYKNFSNVKVLDDISFEVNKGEVLTIIGPSGSGKSTLLRCITQLEEIDSGEIRICNRTLVKNNKENKAIYASKDERTKIALHIGLVFQNFNLFPHLSVIENVMEAPIRVLGKSKEEAKSDAIELLKKMSLENRMDAYPCNLSGGQQQRVSIARALAMKPDILFFDEPTSALDPELTAEILKVIKGLSADHMTMVIVTHEMGFAYNVSDKIIFMDKGKIIESGTAKEVFDNTENERTKKFLSRLNNVE